MEIMHVKPERHKSKDLIYTIGKGANRLLHENQNDIWVIKDNSGIHTIILGHIESRGLLTEFQIDMAANFDSVAEQGLLEDFIREFMGDKKSYVVTTPKLTDSSLISAFAFNGFFQYGKGGIMEYAPNLKHIGKKKEE